MPARIDSTRWIAILAPGVVAAVVFWSTLGGGFLSDDFVIATLWNESTDSADWSRVFADFGRPWFGLDAPLYRPLLTLSFGVDLALHGTEPFGYHVTNLLLHAIATVSTATVAFVLGERHGAGGRAAFACGLFVAVHPACAESVAWIAARNSGLEVAFRSAALACFALHLRSGSRRASVAAWALAACALASKESAVVLVPCALAIDVLHRADRPRASRIRLHLPMAGLLVGYFALRIALFGEPLGSPGDSASDAGMWSIAIDKLAAVLWPSGGTLSLPWFAPFALIATFTACAVGLVRLRHPLSITAALLLVPTLMLPTHSLELDASLAGSRLILGAVHATAFTLAATAFAVPRIQTGATVCIGLCGLAFLSPTHQRLEHFEHAWRCSRAVLRDLDQAGRNRAEDLPIALLGVNNTPPGTPPLNPNAWFPLAQRPFQPSDHPLVSLGFIGIVEVPGSRELTGDPCAARELWQAGARILFWNEAAVALGALPVRGEANLSWTEVDGVHRFVRSVTAFDFELVTGSVDGATSGAVTLVPSTPLPPTVDLTVAFEVFDGRFAADLSHLSAAILLQGAHVGVDGVRLRFDRDDAHARDVVVHPRVPEFPTPRVEGATCTIREFVERLGRHPGKRLVVLAPQGGLVLPTDDVDGTVHVPEPTRRILDAVLALSRSSELWFYIESDPTKGASNPSRSRLDRVVIRH